MQSLRPGPGRGSANPAACSQRWRAFRRSFALPAVLLAASFSLWHAPAAFARKHVFPTSLRDLRARIQHGELSHSEYASTLESLKKAYEQEIFKWGRRGKWQKSLDFLTEMDELSFDPGVPAFAAAVRALSERARKQWPRALMVFNQMKDRELSPDTETFHWAMAGCAKDRQWQLSIDLLREMQRLNMPTRKATYMGALHACQWGGLWQDAISLIEEMENDALDPQAIGFNKAMDACMTAHQDDWYDIMEDKAAARGYEIFL